MTGDIWKGPDIFTSLSRLALGNQTIFPQVKWVGCEAAHSPLSSAKVKNVCASSTPWYVFMVGHSSTRIVPFLFNEAVHYKVLMSGLGSRSAQFYWRGEMSSLGLNRNGFVKCEGRCQWNSAVSFNKWSILYVFSMIKLSIKTNEMCFFLN
jgi:hypothetical protein